MADDAVPPADPNAPLLGAASTINRSGLLAIVWVCFGVATLFVGTRLVVRFRQNHRFLPDDYWIIFAWLTTLTMAILQSEQMDALWYMTNLQSGRVAYDPVEFAEQNFQLTRWQFPVITLFWIILWSVKASFLALFYRVVKPFPVIRRLWYCVCAFAAAALIASILCSTFTCSPPSDYFYGDCGDPQEVWMQRFNVIFSTTVDVASDLMIMALPIAVLPSLQLDKRKKIGLGIAFCLGIIIICVAIVRMTQVIASASVDLVGLAIWGAVETATSLVVGSLPPLKGILARSVKKYASTRRTGAKYGGYGSSKSREDKGFSNSGASRNVMVSESIPLDDVHRSSQMDGGIYVHKTFETNVRERDELSSSSRGDDDEVAIVRGRAF